MQTTTPAIFDVFSSELAPGETVYWSGQPKTSVVFHKEDIGMIPFSLMWGGFAVFWLFAASGTAGFSHHAPEKSFEWVSWIWGSAFVLIGQYMIWGRFVYAYWKKQRTYYALTTKRALIVIDGFRDRTASSAYFETTPIIEKSVRHDGIGSICFGGPVSGEWKMGRNRTPRLPTFDDIDSADSVYQTAARLREQSRRPAAPTLQTSFR
jgi:hypothetical protein